MAKNTNVSGFRKIDIDKYDPENYDVDDESTQVGDERGPNEAEIVGFLNK